MLSEKRRIEDLIPFAIIPIVMNMASNIVYFIGGDSYKIIELVNGINAFTGFSIGICCLFNYLTKSRGISEEEEKELNKKMYGIKLLNIIFIGYLIFTIFIIKNTSIILSGIIMYAGYINVYFIKRKSRRISGLSETQRNWRKVYNRPSYDEINFWWKVKPMLVPHISVSINERIKNISWIVLIFIVPFLTQFRLEALPIMAIVFMLTARDVLYFLDVIFGTYTETKGICTGIVRKENSKSRRVYYKIYVTDFTNKREVSFVMYDYCNYNENDGIKVIHGGLSKKVIQWKIINKRF